MPKTKIEIVVSLVLIAVLAGLTWWLFFGPTPKQKFIREIERTVKTVNEGGHLSVQDKFSPEFIRFLDQQGVQPKQVLLMYRQLDVNQNAQYTFQKLSLYEDKSFAEADFSRKTVDGETGFTIPFVYRDGKWWITDHFKSEKNWDGLSNQF